MRFARPTKKTRREGRVQMSAYGSAALNRRAFRARGPTGRDCSPPCVSFLRTCEPSSFAGRPPCASCAAVSGRAPPPSARARTSRRARARRREPGAAARCPAAACCPRPRRRRRDPAPVSRARRSARPSTCWCSARPGRVRRLGLGDRVVEHPALRRIELELRLRVCDHVAQHLVATACSHHSGMRTSVTVRPVAPAARRQEPARASPPPPRRRAAA